LLDDGTPFDAAIIDTQMSAMDGCNLLAEIRRRRSAFQLSIIALTSIGASVQTFASLDIAQILTKPTKSAVLHDALGKLFAPVSDAVDTTPVASPTKAPLGQTNPLRILLAEDVLISQCVATLLFERIGYKLELACNGLEVLTTVSCRPFDIIFLDVQMPGMDGLTCARRLCAEYPVDRRPWIIALTAHALDGDREICLDAGMDDYLSKPLTGKAIIAAINRATSHLTDRQSFSI
jgi:CheY-like chemotaxis protein